MTTLTPRSPYTVDEIQQLYPKRLRLEQVQVILRHGERTPVTARFQNTGLPEQWPYCQAAKRLAAVVMTSTGWDVLQYQRRMEVFGLNDVATLAKGPNGELDAICQPGELTDPGRQSTLALGQRLRHLYVDQLSFMPTTLTTADILLLRASPIQRALESVQQAFTGFYPSSTRSITDLPTIVTRSAENETLFPNDMNCKRFRQLSKAFADRCAERWNDSPEMDYINSKISRWMPKASPRVLVDGHPRLSGVMDTINATLAHGKATRLPSEFYDEKLSSYVDKIAVEEWFAGYGESQEYRLVGIGGLAADVVTRMVGHAEDSLLDGSAEAGAVHGESDARMRFAMSGAHDTTLAAFLASFGAFKGEAWPPYTSHIAIELFKRADLTTPSQPDAASTSREAKEDESTTGSTTSTTTTTTSSLLSPLGRFLHRTSPSTSPSTSASSPSNAKEPPIARTPTEDLTPAQRQRLHDYFVRIRYNDRPVTVPGCTPAGKHLDGDETFCTLAAFKEIADKFTPKNWKAACLANLDQDEVPEKFEKAGY